jgi:hypothetical protein
MVYASIDLFGVCQCNYCNIRYEWLVRPYSKGSFILEETSSFAWRTNGLAQLPMVLARQASQLSKYLQNAPQQPMAACRCLG